MSVSPIAFRAAVHEQLDAFMSARGFTVAAAEPDVVRYESANVFVQFGHAAHDSEIYARIGRLGLGAEAADRESESLDVGLFLAVADPDAHLALSREVPSACADTQADVQRVLSHFARGLELHGRRLLSGDPAEYASARSLRFWHARPSPPHEYGSATPKA